MNILIIGGGGREHCLAWKISQNSDVKKIYALPGNPGISQIGTCVDIYPGKNSFKDIADFAREKEISFTVVGPEAPLVDGIVDFFNSNNLKIFGPGKNAARIEGSKIFTKQLCNKYGIPTAESVTFERIEYKNAMAFIKNKKDSDFPVVLKADGLAAGKGVIIAQNRMEALSALDDFFVNDIFGFASDRIIIEDYLEGFEVSILSICDGKDMLPMLPAQDYKKIFDQDKGKNTGGMGSYCPVPLIDDKLYKKILDQIIYPTFEALLKENIEYRGILYGGVIVCGGQPYLLEYNCRFGDPETQAILPLLDSDLLELLLAAQSGNLGGKKISWKQQKCVCVVIASKGYPETSSKNEIIKGLDRFLPCGNDKDEVVFHAGTRADKNHIYTNGGRVLGAVARAGTFREARKKVYDMVSLIDFEGAQYRKDIALRAEED